MIYDLSSPDVVTLWVWLPSSNESYNTTAYVFNFIPDSNQTIVSSWNVNTQPICVSPPFYNSSWNKSFSISTTNGTFANWILTAEGSYLKGWVNYTGAFPTMIGVSHLPIQVNKSLVSLTGTVLQVTCSVSSLTAKVDNGKEAAFLQVSETSVRFQVDPQKKSGSTTTSSIELNCLDFKNPNSVVLELDFSVYPNVNNNLTIGPIIEISFGFPARNNQPQLSREKPLPNSKISPRSDCLKPPKLSSPFA
jgi:hypothetical protein